MSTGTVEEHVPIPRRQDEDEFVAMRAAARRTYDRADLIRLAQNFGTIVLAIAAPLLALFWPHGSDPLAIAAVVWLFAGRTWLKSLHRSLHTRSAKFQELYDVGLFGLEWNTAVAGPRWKARDAISTVRAHPIDKDRGWYEKVPEVPWPLDALACQVQNLLWSRKNHRAYATVLWTGFAVVIALALAVWAAKDFSTGDFLAKLFVPLVPALLDLSELPRQHQDAAQARERLEESIQDLWQRHAAGRPITASDCREVQDSIFEMRTSTPPVATWVHRYMHKGIQSANATRMEDIRQEIARLAAG